MTLPVSLTARPRTCRVGGCDGASSRRGMCEMHYRRLRRTGNVGDAAPMREGRHKVVGTDRERFFAEIQAQPNGCWRWTGGVCGGGYGVFTVKGRGVRAHRWAYQTFVGPVPRGMHVDHRCHNADTSCLGGRCAHKRCANPAHLEVVTFAENIRRARLRTNS